MVTILLASLSVLVLGPNTEGEEAEPAVPFFLASLIPWSCFFSFFPLRKLESNFHVPHTWALQETTFFYTSVGTRSIGEGPHAPPPALTPSSSNCIASTFSFPYLVKSHREDGDQDISRLVQEKGCKKFGNLIRTVNMFL